MLKTAGNGICYSMGLVSDKSTLAESFHPQHTRTQDTVRIGMMWPL